THKQQYNHQIQMCDGSFNISKKAREYLHKTGRFIVIGGIISPVHDSYGKPGLVSSRHRLTMCQLAVQSSDWIRVDPWECYQDTWQTTCSVLEHHRDLMKVWTFLSVTKHPHYIISVAHFSLHENANLGTAMRYEEIELRILLLCGSDLLESFCIPGLWKDSDMEVIVGDFGIVVVPRDGADTERIMNHSSILRKYKDNIVVVKDVMNHPLAIVSSTKSRLALQHGDGHVVDYLSQPVIDYILQSQLYINASG
uniref:Nicotinamide/nicotinic acid mononucleotide adenylyltransferase 2 n=1 Tax=Seriola lalandi dorsalis TaxID=1841481 RepID=A0A3B4WJR1_SERLL